MNRIFQTVPSVQKMKMTAADPNGPERISAEQEREFSVATYLVL